MAEYITRLIVWAVIFIIIYQKDEKGFTWHYNVLMFLLIARIFLFGGI